MSDAITNAVRSKYGSVAGSGLSSEHSGVRAVAEAFGYSPEELASIPAGANMGLSCGNPTATANLREGEVVVDLGAGGGLDVLLAARKVGPTGKAVGIDMTPEMVDLARRNAEAAGVSNVEFHLATIDDLPLADASVDCVISNCVINLAPDKPAVLREVARVLKPGGRLAVSDIALKKDLPGELGNDLMAYVGCIAGAIPIDDYRRMLLDAGFSGVEVVDTGADLNAYAKVENQAACCPPPSASGPAIEAKAAESCCSPAPASTGLPIAEAGCCSAPTPSPAPTPAGLSVVDSGCCSPAPAPAVSPDDAALHDRLADLLRRYDVNDYAASVRVFAVKPG
ncbi:arsenite methyltransferase [Tautonia plasticadhaerens]|uniref:Arsenite methyltransferase n=1 Tax=Tautonia plasticadhaerens TaxID=2527974 RepID=A0A518HDJ3_9BACT|nr:arsenite methyltransferase [Tautonia plasticadhaerens]QDV38924.1 Ubiquinone/menaquinone biosynthesis C-methyltransferase UbiE [Tautonia plasticadhaerens]